MPKYTIKQILLHGDNWHRFYLKNHKRIRASITEAIAKLIACRTKVFGYKKYSCPNTNCSHTKCIHHTCKSRACSSCGKKATETWINKQNEILPITTWQHITFTMPSILWDLFWYNRSLINDVAKIPYQCLSGTKKAKALLFGAFMAIHTFGRDMKKNIHFHVSVTCGGLNKENQWKTHYFHTQTLMRMWRYQLITLLRKLYQNGALILSKSILCEINNANTFEDILNQSYKTPWVVNAQKSDNNHKKNVSYLGKYIKRPPIAQSKLTHFRGDDVIFKFYDHKEKTWRQFHASVNEFISRFISHIPDKGFRMIRYYGFLANRIRSKALPLVQKALNLEEKFNNIIHPITYAQMSIKEFNLDPLCCVLCGSQMVCTETIFADKQNTYLDQFYTKIAFLRRQ